MHSLQEPLLRTDIGDRLFALSEDMLCVAGVDGYLKRVNPAMIEQTGYSEQELLALNFLSFAHPDDHEAIVSAIGRLGDGQRSKLFECRCRYRDGAYRWVGWTGSLAASEGLMYAIGREMTAQRAQQERLAYMASIIECSNEAIISLTPDGICTSWNRMAERLYGYQAQEMIGQPISVLARGSLLAEQEDLLRRAREGECVTGVETRRYRADGLEIHVSLTLSAIRGSDGEICGLSAIGHDITPMKEARLALIASNEALEEAMVAADAANRAKTEFLTNMSHEIRTPMTAIMGFAELLDDQQSPPRTREAAESIRRNGAHLLRIINDLLDLSKIEAGKLELDLQPCAPRQIVQDVTDTLRDRAVAKGLEFTAACGADLPRLVLTDPTRVRQIVTNLVENAIKFTSEGYVRLTLGVAAPKDDMPRLSFEIEDTGIGIPETHRRQLFVPFSQGDMSVTRAYGGMGLGLAVSQRLAYMLGAEISVQSAADKGSVFRLLLPVAYLDISKPERRRSCALASRLARLDGCRVLVADDCPDNRRLMLRLLEMAGAKVVTAEDGAKAVAAVLGDSIVDEPLRAGFDVILMDMQMPVLDGYQATRELRQRGYEGAIIAVTANAMSTDRQRCIDAGCDDYLAKPILSDELTTLVLSHSRAGDLVVGCEGA